MQTGAAPLRARLANSGHFLEQPNVAGEQGVMDEAGSPHQSGVLVKARDLDPDLAANVGQGALVDATPNPAHQRGSTCSRSSTRMITSGLTRVTRVW